MEKDIDRLYRAIKESDAKEIDSIVDNNSFIAALYADDDNATISDLIRTIDVTDPKILARALSHIDSSNIFNGIMDIYDTSSKECKEVIIERLNRLQKYYIIRKNENIIDAMINRRIMSPLLKARDEVLSGGLSFNQDSRLLFSLPGIEPIDGNQYNTMLVNSYGVEQKIAAMLSLTNKHTPDNLKNPEVIRFMASSVFERAEDGSFTWQGDRAVKEFINSYSPLYCKELKPYLWDILKNQYPENTIEGKMLLHMWDQTEESKKTLEDAIKLWMPEKKWSFYSTSGKSIQMISSFLRAMYEKDKPLMHKTLARYLKKRGSSFVFSHYTLGNIKVDIKELINHMNSFSQRSLEMLSKCECINTKELEPFIMQKIMKNFATIRGNRIIINK